MITRLPALRKQAQFSHGKALFHRDQHDSASSEAGGRAYDHVDSDAGLTVLLLYQDKATPLPARARWYFESRKELVPIHGAFAEIFNGRMFHGTIPAYR